MRELKVRHLVASIAALGALAGAGRAGTIGQWEGSFSYLGQPLTWNSPSYSEVRGVVTAAGHTVAPDGPVNTAVLPGFDAFVIAEPGRMLTDDELTALGGFIRSGGLLLILLDRDMDFADAIPATNAIFAGVGSSIRTSGATMDQNMFLNGGVFATDGPPNNVAGAFLSGTPGHRITGGIALTRGGTTGWNDSQRAAAEAYIHYEQIGLGYAFAFGDRLDNNYFDFGPTYPRAQFFTNLASYVNPHGAAEPTSEAPEPSTAAVGFTGLVGLCWWRWCKTLGSPVGIRRRRRAGLEPE